MRGFREFLSKSYITKYPQRDILTAEFAPIRRLCYNQDKANDVLIVHSAHEKDPLQVAACRGFSFCTRGERGSANENPQANCRYSPSSHLQM